MKVVVVSISDPWAHAHGGTLRTQAFLRGLTTLGHDVTCIYPGNPREAPIPGLRMVGVPTGTVGGRPWPAWLRAAKRALLPMPTMAGGRGAAISAAVSAAGPADLLLVSQLPAAAHTASLEGAGLFLDHSDLWSEFIAREGAGKGAVSSLTSAAQRIHIRRVENRLSADAQVTSAAGWKDAQTLGARIGKPVAWLPTPVLTDIRPVTPRSAPGAPVAGFLANFNFWPNVAAVELLADVWGPALREAGWQIVVAGLGSADLELPDFIRCMGPVAEVSEFYEAVDVTLAPITLGGGMKVKVIESIAYGRPVVGTAFAVEGFPPSVQALVHVTDARSPDFSVLADGPPTLSDPSAALGPFTHAGFTRALEQALAAAGRASRFSG